MRKKKLVKLSRLIPKLIKVDGKPMNYEDFGLFRPFYNTLAIKCMLKSGRQVGKSIATAAKKCGICSIKPHMSIMTCLPLREQVRRFSTLYVDGMMRHSPVLKSRLSSKLSQSVTLKELNNGSKMYFCHIGITADSARGIATKRVCWDEIQDILTGNISVVEQCASSHADSKFSYTGTPKTMDNTMEILWKKSTMSEPVVVCQRCKYENLCLIPDVYKMLQKEGLCCQKCGRKISMEQVRNSFYIHGRPDRVGEFEGFHIPQIFTPKNLDPRAWARIMRDYKDYQPYRFANEVLGLSFDQGGKPVTLEDLIRTCREHTFENYKANTYTHTFMGIDWGCASADSLTSCCILGLTPFGEVEVIFAEKYYYQDRVLQMERFNELISKYNCKAVGVDFGVGAGDNYVFRHRYGNDFVYEYQYLSMAKILQWNDETCRFSLSKTLSLSLLFTALKQNHIGFPEFSVAKDFFDDILSIYEEISEGPHGSKKIYKRNPSIPDDFCHALNFALITLRLYTEDTILKSAMV